MKLSFKDIHMITSTKSSDCYTEQKCQEVRVQSEAALQMGLYVNKISTEAKKFLYIKNPFSFT